MKNKKEILGELYIELVKLQKEIISSNLKLLVILEGRDLADEQIAYASLSLSALIGELLIYTSIN